MTSRPINILFVKVGTEPGLEEIPRIVKSFDDRITTLGVVNDASDVHHYDRVVSSVNEAVLGTHAVCMRSEVFVRPELYEKVSQHEGRILRMYDRITPDDVRRTGADRGLSRRYSGSLHERSQVFLRQTAFWDHVISSTPIHAVVAQNYGHNGWDAVVHAVAESNGVPYLFFHEVRPFLGSLIVCEDLRDLDDWSLTRRLILSAQQAGQWLSEPIDRQQYLLSQVQDTPKTSIELRTSIGSLAPSAFKRVRNVRRLRTSIVRRYLVRQNMREYHLAESNQPLPSKFIFCELQSQPNATTAVKGWMFADQSESLALIAKHLPFGWKLLVKESDRQWSRQIARPQGYWERISQIPGVVVCPQSMNSVEALQSASALLETSYSTLALEAIHQGLPVIVLGHSHIARLNGVYSVRSESDVQPVMSEIFGSTRLDLSRHRNRELAEFVEEFRSSSIGGALSSTPTTLRPDEFSAYRQRVMVNVAGVIVAWTSEIFARPNH
jgi:hypothetical protein